MRSHTKLVLFDLDKKTLLPLVWKKRFLTLYFTRSLAANSGSGVI